MKQMTIEQLNKARKLFNEIQKAMRTGNVLVAKQAARAYTVNSGMNRKDADSLINTVIFQTGQNAKPRQMKVRAPKKFTRPK